jgi:hypothetical protein
MVGAFLAWNEQFNKAVLAGTPEISIEYEMRPTQIAAPSLLIKSLGGGNAYRLRIRNMTNSSAIASFDEVSHLEEKQTCEATATFNEFLVPTPFFPENFAAFLRTMVDWKRNLGTMEAIEQHLAPQTIKVFVDYFNVSDMRFTPVPCHSDVRYQRSYRSRGSFRAGSARATVFSVAISSRE